jgi:hypothetical protein
LGHRRSLGPLRQNSDTQPPVIERPDSAPGESGQRRAGSLVSTESTAMSMVSNPLSSASSAPQQHGTILNDEGGESQTEIKDEDEDDEDEDDMLDMEEGGSGVPQTAAERRAERRKMKRFRYVNKQAP